MSVDDLVAVLGHLWLGMDPGHVPRVIHLLVSVVLGFRTDRNCVDLYAVELFIFDLQFLIAFIVVTLLSRQPGDKQSSQYRDSDRLTTTTKFI